MKLVSHFTRYCVVAVGSALTDWLVFTAGVLIFETYFLYAQMVSRIAGGMFSFLANRYWSFGSGGTGRIVREGRRFLLLYAISYFLSIILLYAADLTLGFSPFVSKLVTDALIFLFNFAVMNSYVYRDRRGLSGLLFGRSQRI